MWTLTMCLDPTHDDPEVVGTFDTLAEARAASHDPLTYREGPGRWSSRGGDWVAVYHPPA